MSLIAALLVIVLPVFLLVAAGYGAALAAMPPGINGYVFAAMYDRAVGTAASAVVLGTALSLLTITVWLALLGGAGM